MKRWGIAVLCFAILLVVSARPLLTEERQPHMQSALHHLQEAEKQLQEAAHDKAGHRERALKLTDDAIRQVQAGIEAGEHERR